MESLNFDYEDNVRRNDINGDLAMFDQIVERHEWDVIKAKLIDDTLLVCVVYERKSLSFILLTYDFITLHERSLPQDSQYFKHNLCIPRRFAMEAFNKTIAEYSAYGCFIVDLPKG